MGCTLVYCCMFGIGELVLQSYATGVFLLVIATIAGYLIYWSLARRGWSTFSGATESAAPAAAAETD